MPNVRYARFIGIHASEPLMFRDLILLYFIASLLGNFLVGAQGLCIIRFCKLKSELLVLKKAIA